ncbi:50S ribosomal protein L25 [Paenibacillus senegalimassiliensis]|uniref:50S ribosomal protein L25 n=1 Tax=Paenibacillus senegalimassiliensis TaxID=1737426 RepID=UPI00073E98D9|nr:50S ribosomal protein L25 [Paenibacillus senegalimassiliensis]
MSTNHHTFQLNVTPRTEFHRSSLRELRQNGRVPAVVYGGESENLAVHVDVKQLVKVARTGRSEFFDLKVEGGQTLPVLIKDLQQRRGEIIHADFQQVSKNKPIRVKVPLSFTGTAQGTKVGGILQFQATELDVEGLPGVLPASLEIDITALDVGDKLTASEVELPKGIILHAQPEEVLAVVLQQTLDTAAEDAGAADSEPDAEAKNTDEG